MAERRMFAKAIVLSDAFLDMPMSTRCLYFTLSMFADDDGFVGSPKGIARQCGASEDDFKMLLAKRFILGFDSGVIVIKHWRLNNYLRNDRYKPTTYIEEFNTLMLDEKDAYTEKVKEAPEEAVPELGIPNGYQMDTQYSIGKESIGKESIGEGKEKNKETDKETREPCDTLPKKRYGTFRNVEMTEDEFNAFKNAFPDYQDKINHLSEYMRSSGRTYNNHYATLLSWANKDEEKKKEQRRQNPVHFDNERDYTDEQIAEIQRRAEAR